jgi:hypothetical protein
MEHIYPEAQHSELVKAAFTKFREYGLAFTFRDGAMYDIHIDNDDSSVVEELVARLTARGFDTGAIIDELLFFAIPWSCDESGSIVGVDVDERERVAPQNQPAKRQKMTETDEVPEEPDEPVPPKRLLVGLMAYNAYRDNEERCPLEKLERHLHGVTFRINPYDKNKLGKKITRRVQIIYGHAQPPYALLDMPCISILDSRAANSKGPETMYPPEWMEQYNPVVVLHYNYRDGRFSNLDEDKIARLQKLFTE